MSVSLSLYDVFSNIVPGLIYLFAINEFLWAFGKSQVDLLQASTSGQILFITFIAFVLGQLLLRSPTNGFIDTYSDYRVFVAPRWKRRIDRISLRFGRPRRK